MQLLLVLIMMMAKLSVLTSYTRFATSTFRYVVWVMMAIILAWGIGMPVYLSLETSATRLTLCSLQHIPLLWRLLVGMYEIKS